MIFSSKTLGTQPPQGLCDLIRHKNNSELLQTREDTSAMVNQATTTSCEILNTGFPPNWETNDEDDEPPPLVQYENDSSDDESNDGDNLPWEESNQHRQIYWALQQKMCALQQKVHLSTSTEMNHVYMQQTANEIATMQQQINIFQQQ